MWTPTQHLVIKLSNSLKRRSTLPTTWIQRLGRLNTKFSTEVNPDAGVNPGVTRVNPDAVVNLDVGMYPGVTRAMLILGTKPYLGKNHGLTPDQLAAFHYLYPGVEKIPGYIESAFRSSRTNEVYFFLNNKYMRLEYFPGKKTEIDGKILIDLHYIYDDFPSLSFGIFGLYGVKCSFDTEGNKAYIFNNKECAYIDYVNDKILLQGKLDQIFPVLKNTVFEDGIDSAFRSSRGKEVYLFRDDKYACIDYDTKQLIGTICNLTDGFPVLKGTIFEDGIHACFASHKENQVYLFKGKNYVMMNFTPGTTDHTFVDVVKPIVKDWSSFRGILPLLDYDLGPTYNYVPSDED